MIDTNKLKGKIVENGMTQAQVAEEIGMTAATFTRKMQSGRFGTDEAERMIRLLNITDPCAIFFANEVT